MDALVHIFYEIAGVTGTFATGLGLIPRRGNNYAFIVTSICFAIAGTVWLFIKSVAPPDDDNNIEGGRGDDETPMDQSIDSNYFKAVLKGFYLFEKSFFLFTHRKFIWLWSCYFVAR